MNKIVILFYLISFIICCLFSNSCKSVIAVKNQKDIISHAHNDYLQDTALYKALRLDYNSIEIDIIHSEDKLIVSHDNINLESKPTIQELYFDPLKSYLSRNKSNLWLLVDIKHNDGEILNILHKVVENYNDLFIKRMDKAKSKPLKIVLSGDFSREELASSNKYPYFFIDGRPNHLNRNFDSHIMPLISTKLGLYANVDNTGFIGSQDSVELINLIQSVHMENKIIRFWGTPDTEAVWSLLADFGVDVIGVDDLEQYSNFKN